MLDGAPALNFNCRPLGSGAAATVADLIKLEPTAGSGAVDVVDQSGAPVAPADFQASAAEYVP
jgi:hypothetical protein